MKRPILTQVISQEEDQVYHQMLVTVGCPIPEIVCLRSRPTMCLSGLGFLLCVELTSRGIETVVSIVFIVILHMQSWFHSFNTFMRNFIHFSSARDRKPKGHKDYDPLFKVRLVLHSIMKAIRTCWTVGLRVTIDESMIRYMGRAVAFVQYMPQKPIKHWIKVFAICCAYTAVLLGFEVYCGAMMDNVDGSVDAVILMRVIKDAGLDELYTLIIGTWRWNLPSYFTLNWDGCFVEQSHQHRKLQDKMTMFLFINYIPELCLLREAVIEKITSTGKRFWIQCTSWIDSKSSYVSPH